jgi:hypothetical protein
LRCLANLLHLAGEGAFGVRIDREGDGLPRRKPADVRLHDRGLDLHPSQILRDGEQGWCVQAGGDGLASVDAAVHHRAGDRCADVRVLEIDLRLPQHRLFLLHLRDVVGELRLGRPKRRPGGAGCGGLGLLLCASGVHLRLGGTVGVLRLLPNAGGDDLPLGQRPLAVELPLGVVERELGAGDLRLGRQVRGLSILQLGAVPIDLRALHRDEGLHDLELGLGLADLGLEALRVDPSNDLALSDRRVEVGVQLLDQAGDLGADLDLHDGVERPGGGDGGHEIASIHRCRPVGRRVRGYQERQRGSQRQRE